MAGKDVAAPKGNADAEPKKKSVARRLWRVARAVLYMLRRGVLATTYGRKLAVDLSLLLRRRGKVAGKVLAGLVSFHHHHHHQNHYAAFSSATARAGSGSGSSLSSFSCRALDPALAVHEPSRGRRREVEFSCSNTPSSAFGAAGGFFGSSKSRGSSSSRRRPHRDDEAATGYYDYDNCDAADIARVFEMLNDDDDGGHLFDDADDDTLALATLSPAPWTSSSPFWRSPVAARQLRVTDSPFAATDNDAAAAGEQQEQVDRKADEFIRRFYEQLRAQKSAAATPDHYGYAASSYNGHAPRRPVAAGIA